MNTGFLPSIPQLRDTDIFQAGKGVGDIPGKGNSLGKDANDRKNTGHLGNCEQCGLTGAVEQKK